MDSSGGTPDTLPNGLTAPFARALIRDGLIFLQQWTPRLMFLSSEQAMYDGIAQAGHKVVDLVREAPSEHVRELFVTPVAGHYLNDSEMSLIHQWASDLAYTHLWEKDALHVLPGLVSMGNAVTRCPVCETEYADDSFDYWSRARGWGMHSQTCAACGIDALPQRVVQEVTQDFAQIEADLFDTKWDLAWQEAAKPVVTASRKAPRALLEEICLEDLDLGEEPLNADLFETPEDFDNTADAE